MYRLCFADPDAPLLYFTDDFEHCWGDDWDDAPYEHNAELPYRKEPGRPQYDRDTNIVRMVYAEDWDGSGGDLLWSPAYRMCLSVEAINKGGAPWIWTGQRMDDMLKGGASIREARAFFKRHGYKTVMLDKQKKVIGGGECGR